MGTHVTPESVVAKCDYFTDVHLWPLQETLNPQQWLSNFNNDEMPFAVHLLDSFMFYSEPICNQLFIASFQTLSRYFRDSHNTYLATQSAWRGFIDTVRITYVTGETPNPTDSGHLFARKARQLLAIPEERIQSPEAIAIELRTSGPRPVVFVDDFVGSGSQFLETWNRPFDLGQEFLTFSDLAQVPDQRFFYCPLLCCQDGYDAIRNYAPEVIVNCCHILPKTYSAVASNSVLWPPHLLPNARSFIESASRRAGLPDSQGKEVNDWQGFHNLGLALAFHHGVPDATLPLFYWEQNGWNPLIRRS